MGVVVLVRHGQASFGTDDYDVLSPTGWEQARLLGAWLAARGVRPDVLVRGDMRRHRETVEGVAAGAAAVGAAGAAGTAWSPTVEVDAGWDEFDHLEVIAALDEGASVGELDRRAFQRAFERATARWTAGGHDADYPEPWPAFVARVRASLGRACDAAGPGGTVVVVSSGGPIAAACAELVDPDGDDPAVYARLWNRFNTVTVNSSMTRVVVGSTGRRLLTFNEHPHLEGDTLTYR
jgi:broad specificity phosphatase PhoE